MFSGPHEIKVSLDFEKEQNLIVIELATELRQVSLAYNTDTDGETFFQEMTKTVNLHVFAIKCLNKNILLYLNIMKEKEFTSV